MVVSNAGTVIAGADGRANSGDIPTAIDCVIRRSLDNGDTWGTPIVVSNYGSNASDTDMYPLFSATVAQARTSASDPALLVDRSNGRIWVFYDNGSSASYSGFGRTIKLEMRYSDDDGLTWSARKDIEAENPALRPTAAQTFIFNGTSYTYGTAEYIVGPGSGIQIERGTHAGRLIFPVYWYRTSNNSSFIFSDDHGATWQRGGICGTGTGEVQIVELVNGDLLASMRPSGAAGGYRWFSNSSDGGANWSAMYRFDGTATYPVPDPACQGNIFRLSTTAESDKNRLVHANAANTGSRVNMTVRVSYDEGASWSQSRLVYSGGSAYSSLVRLPNGDIGLLYEKDGTTSIDFVRIPIPTATNNTDAQPGYNLWANTTFTLAQLMNPAISAKGADPDSDGLTNFQDYQNALASRPSASIAATDGVAYEAGPDTTARFTVTLSAAAATDTLVNLVFSGTATAGTDYSVPSAAVTVAAGQTQASVTINALDDAVSDGMETVIATIAAGSGDFPAYTLGNPTSATATVNDFGLPGVTIIATDSIAAETGGDTGTFTISRDDPSLAATVAYSVGGTATAGTDYIALAGTVAFSAGQATASVTVVALDDMLYERLPETVVVTLAPGANYTLGYPIAATVTINSNEINPRKANNNDALNLPSSWLGDAPLATETPVWDSVITGASSTSLGVATNWAGIRVEGDTLAPGGPVTLQGSYSLAAGNVWVGAGSQLVLGNGGSALSLNSLGGSGALTINKTGNQDMSASLNSANAINFTGTLQLRGDGTWTVLGNSATTQASGTKFHLDTGASASNRREFILGNAWDGRTLTLASLSGYGNIRSDWSNTNVVRPLLVAQDINTTFYGNISGHNANGRNVDLTKAGNGALTLAGVLGDWVTLTQSAGTLTLTAANTYTGTTTVTGGTLVVTGSLPATATTVTAGTLAGTGTVKGATTVSGTLSPGIDGLGTLTLTNTLTFNAAATALIQIHKSGTTLSAGKVQGVSTLTYGGTLVVTATGDALAAGDSFTLFSATNSSGAFASLNLPPLAAGLAWDASTAGTITVKAAAVWTNPAGGAWATGTNWLGGTSASGSNVIADFSTLNLTSDAIVTLSTAATTVAGLRFGDITPSHHWSLSGTKILTLAIASGAPVISVNNQTATISTVIAGTQGMLKDGTGTLALTATNTYTGNTTVTAGTLDLTGGGGSIGTIRGAVSVNSGATLRLSSGDALGYAGGTTALTTLNLNGGSLQLATTSNQTLGSGVINLTGGTITGVSNSNLDFYLGASAINSLASSVPSTIGGTALDIRQTSGLTITVAQGATPSGIDLDIASLITNNRPVAGIPGTGASYGDNILIKQGAGKLRLTGVNNWSGGTELLAGSLCVNAISGMGSGYIAIKNGATFQYVGTGSEAASRVLWMDVGPANVDITDASGDLTLTQTGGTISQTLTKTGPGSLTLNATLGGAVNVTAGKLTVGGVADNTGSSATVTGGTLVLAKTGANATANLTVTNGTARLSGANDAQIGNSGTVTLNSGANFDQNGKNETIGTLVLNGGSITGAGTLTVNTAIDARSGSSVTSLGGVAVLSKTTAATVTLSAANTYTGNTTVTAGTLQLAASGQLKFAIGSISGLSNSISGDGTLTVDGSFVIDTAAATALTSGNWILVNLASLTCHYGSTFSVVGFVEAGNGQWTKLEGGRLWTFDAASGVLTLDLANSYTHWAALHVGGGTPNLDYNHDGVCNGVEYFTGQTGASANPVVRDGKITWSKDPAAIATYVVETSTRCTAEVTPGDGGWAPATSGVNDNGTTVEYTLPLTDTMRFARLRITIP